MLPLLFPGEPSGILLASPTLATPRVTGFFFLTAAPWPTALVPPGRELFFWTTATNLHLRRSSRWVQNRSLGSTETLDLNWSWEILQRLAPDICQSAGSILAVLAMKDREDQAARARPEGVERPAEPVEHVALVPLRGVRGDAQSLLLSPEL